MADVQDLKTKVNERLAHIIQRALLDCGELTLEINTENFLTACQLLYDDPELDFKMLIDVCGVDYLHYGIDEWETEAATEKGFERGVMQSALNQPFRVSATIPSRFASVYHLLSLTQNHRIRLRVFLDSDQPKIDSVVDIWPSANWFEREAFDLFGIEFKGHPDLRRILTDYGFIGHPFRKDFPLIGNVEARYDAKLGRVIYEPVSIQPRILEPKVIRHDNRYQIKE